MFGSEHLAHGERWVTSRASRGNGDGGPADCVEAVRYFMIPGEGDRVGEMGVPALPTAARKLRRPRKPLQD